ncbi:MAG: carboxypeptidase-like regulatory domain-containing protein [Bacteroidota bacterium]
MLAAQDTILQKRISAAFDKATLEEMLREITSQSGINFSYNTRLVETNKRITRNFTGESLQNVLDFLARAYDLEYAVVSNQIVLRARKEEPEKMPHFTLSGHVRDKTSMETLPGASILAKNINTGTTTNSYGFYSLSLPGGEYELLFRFVGYQPKTITVSLQQHTRQSIDLEPAQRILNEVTVMASNLPENLRKSQSSRIQANPRKLELLPEFAGENGLIKSLQTLPGIQTHSDGSSFFFVRGGNKDQNLILIDEAPVYNPAHLFGFYSVIIPDVAKEINIYKADMPVENAGRLSSVIDVQTRDGNLKKFAAEGVLNPLMYRFSVEGPVVKEKVSFFTSLRRSNFEWLFRDQAPDSELYMRDFNAKLNWQINDQNRLYLSMFRGHDNYTDRENLGRFGIAWHNYTTTFRWNHIFGDRGFGNATLYRSEYDYTLFTGSFPWKSGIDEWGFKYDLSWYPQPDLTWRFGFSHTLHGFNPGNFTDVDEQANRFIPRVYAGSAFETAVYVNREKRINERWAWRAGLRLPVWVNQGPARVFVFDENRNVADTLLFQDDQTIATYLSPDLRLSGRYLFNEQTSLQLSWGLYHQNVHLLTNSVSPFTSFEVWMPSSQNILPQRAQQLTLGLRRAIPEMGLELEAEVYGKVMKRQIEYVNHARLLLNPMLEGELIFGKGTARGLELSVKRTKGRLTGWASYTWARVFNQFEDINNSVPFPAYQDRPHDLSVFLNWQAGQKLIVSLNWIYHTGSPITTPVGFYHYDGSTVPVYDRLNNDRLPDYHRLDLSLSWIIGRPHHRYQHNLTLGLYNLYNRINPIAINFNKVETQNGNFVVPADYFGTHEIMSTQKYLGGIMPSLTYKFSLQ